MLNQILAELVFAHEWSVESTNSQIVSSSFYRREELECYSLNRRQSRRKILQNAQRHLQKCKPARNHINTLALQGMTKIVQVHSCLPSGRIADML